MGSTNGAHPKRYRPRLYHITFPEGHVWEDVEAKLKGASVDTLLNLMEVADDAADVVDGAVRVTEKQRAAVTTMIAEFAPLIHWWNVDDSEGKPVTPDEAGVRAQDFAMVFALFTAWQQRIALVPPPLPDASPGGPSSGIEASIPMETLSASPPSS